MPHLQQIFLADPNNIDETKPAMDYHSIHGQDISSFDLTSTRMLGVPIRLMLNYND